MDATMALNCAIQVDAGMPCAPVGGGPPVLLNKMSTGPKARSTRVTWPSMAPRSARSQTKLSARACGATAAAMRASASGLRPASATDTPSRASAKATAPPSPPVAPSTNAVRPCNFKSIG